MTVPTDDAFRAAREIIKGGRVYVPESVKHEFGDDWSSFRRDRNHKEKPRKPLRSTVSGDLAEKSGFEPERRSTRPTPLAGEPLRPLGYFSNCRSCYKIAQPKAYVKAFGKNLRRKSFGGKQTSITRKSEEKRIFEAL